MSTIKKQILQKLLFRMERSETRRPSGLDSWSTAFFLYINDLLGIINERSKPTIFADDTNIIFTQPDRMIF